MTLFPCRWLRFSGILPVFPLVCSLYLLIGVPRAQAEPPAGLDDFVNAELKEYKTPGASVAVIEGDHIFAKGYGVRSINKPQPFDADTLLPIASVTKAFTAALVAIEVDEHKFGWDDRVVDHLPGFQLQDMYATSNCTPRDLLAHRCGLPAFGGDTLEAIGYSREEILHRIRYIKPACTFRERANYSNPGIFMAGMMAAHAANTTYETLLETRLFEKLQMTRSGWSYKDYDTKSNVAEGHDIGADGTQHAVAWDDDFGLGPAGEITSTANDLAHFVQMQLSDGRFNGMQIVSPESIREMHKPAIVSDPTFAEMPPIDEHSNFSFALGWDVYCYKGHQIIEKAGARLGVRSIIVLVPDKKLGFVVLANENMTMIPEAIRAYLIDKMVEPAGVDLQAMIRAKNEQLQKVFGQAAKQVPKQTAPISLPLAKYAGDFQNELYGKFTVFVDKGHLRYRIGPANIEGPLDPIGYNTFSLSWPPTRVTLPENVTFTIAEDGAASSVMTESIGEFTKIAAKKTSSELGL
jgi:CubicO group peptidase (beta-lactamase class C family)